MKNGKQARTKIVQFRVSPEELIYVLAKFEDNSGETTIKASEIAREAFLGCKAIKPVNRDLEKYKIATAARIGNNVNQIAHRLNSDHLAHKIDDQTYKEVSIELHTLVNQLNILL